MTLPSLSGVMPMLEAMMAFSIFASTDLSHGWIEMVRGSGVEMPATSRSLVGVP